MFGKNQPTAETAGSGYLTLGGATVTLDTLSPEDSHLAQINAVCGGCGETEYVCGLAANGEDAGANLKRVEAKAGEWAQDHAGTCRATPKASQ